MARKDDITLYQGANYTFTIEDNDDQFDFSNLNFYMEIRENEDKSSTLILDVGPYISVDTSAEKATIDIPASETSSMSFDTAYYDLFMEDTGENDTFVLLEGCVNLNKQVTDV